MSEDGAAGQRLEFSEVQIGIGLRPLAQHGFVVLDAGTLTLLGTQRQEIASAPIAEVTARRVRMTMGRTLSMTVAGTKYNVSPNWGTHLGSGTSPLLTRDVKSAADLLLSLVEQAH
ncbi:hypothetical protein [Streptacidiphilus sp. EB129]|uniref:hypothetical protein n=1 Tax=Streptacidiphilus sp. EB129 TaxID=3156262 RepID=UPI003512FA93